MLKEENTKAKTNEELDNDVIDVALPDIKKKRLRFDGDNNRIAYINISDLSVVSRLEEMLPKLNELAAKAAEELGNINEDDSVGETLKKVDSEMRDAIDYIFDAGVSDAAVPRGTMYDVHNGEFTFEHIIDVITKQYENNLNTEFNKIQNRIKSYTDKYASKSRKKRK